MLFRQDGAPFLVSRGYVCFNSPSEYPDRNSNEFLHRCQPVCASGCMGCLCDENFLCTTFENIETRLNIMRATYVKVKKTIATQFILSASLAA